MGLSMEVLTYTVQQEKLYAILKDGSITFISNVDI
jgi:hypothetical protein